MDYEEIFVRSCTLNTAHPWLALITDIIKYFFCIFSNYLSFLFAGLHSLSLTVLTKLLPLRKRKMGWRLMAEKSSWHLPRTSSLAVVVAAAVVAEVVEVSVDVKEKQPIIIEDQVTFMAIVYLGSCM